MSGWGASWGDAQFPDGFLWGAATAAYQIEGAIDAGGRGRSIWDTFCAEPGAVLNGDSGAVACDHFNRYQDDVALLAGLGLKSYRFSVAWPRIQPTGAGEPVGEGIGFYDRLVDELLAHGIEPMMTLYHWDLPQELEYLGGWTNRDIADRFADYAAQIYTPLADRVKIVSTLNEPWCSAFLGYGSGDHAPGHRNATESLTAAHHLLLAHGRGIEALRSIRSDANLGIVLNPSVVTAPGAPMSWSEAERDAVRRVDAIRNRIWFNALLEGAYPDDLLVDIDRIDPALRATVIHDGDLATIAAPIDHIGVNYYNREVVELVSPNDPPANRPSPYAGCDDVKPAVQSGPRTDIGWPIDASGLRDLLVGMHRRYPNLPPVYITENGAAYDDPIQTDGTINDARRVRYLDAHIRAVHAAIGDGVDVRGYFGWSLLDNFEWAWGYSMRFGLVHVDYDTQVRTPKASARFLGRAAQRNGLLAE